MKNLFKDYVFAATVFTLTVVIAKKLTKEVIIETVSN